MRIFLDAMTFARNRDAVIAWVRANGLDPAMIPLGREFAIDDGRLTVPYYVIDADGHRVLNSQRMCLETYDMTVPLLTDWPL